MYARNTTPPTHTEVLIELEAYRNVDLRIIRHGTKIFKSKVLVLATGA